MNKTLSLLLCAIALFASSGSLAQTTLVKDINKLPAGLKDSYNYNSLFCMECGAYLYFTTRTSLGQELWRTDGTADGTIMVKDLYKGYGSGLFQFAYGCLNDYLFFGGNSGSATGNELWKTNGTSSGTMLVKDIEPGPFPSSPRGFVSYNNKLYFFKANSPSGAMNLWQTDGTAEGTLHVSNLHPSDTYTFVLEATRTGQFFYFTTIVHKNNTSPYMELWRSDGTSSGTIRLHESLPAIFPIKAVGNNVFFKINKQLWKSNGTVAGTTMVKEFISTSIYNLHAFNDKLIFNAENRTWISDGLESGTFQLFSNTLSGGVVYNNKFYGIGNDYSLNSSFLVRTDGTIAGTAKLAEVGIEDPQMSDQQIPVVNDRFIVRGQKSGFGSEPVITDGTVAGTQLLKDIYPGLRGSDPRAWAHFKNQAIFLADDGAHGIELWISNGTSEGTKLLKDICTGTQDALQGFSSNFRLLNNKIYFLATDSLFYDLWQSDGTTEGTKVVYDLNSYWPNLVAMTDTDIILFDNGKFFKSNGQPGGTTLLKEVSGNAGENENWFNLGNKAIFNFFSFGNPYDFGSEYWVTDGTTIGTHVLKDINPGPSDGASLLGKGQTLNNKLIFPANNGADGHEVWITDGTEANTVLLKDIYPGAESSSPYSFVRLNDLVLFNAKDGVHGAELWKTNGTAGGTSLVKDIAPGISSDPRFLTPVGTVVMFTAFDQERGWALWKTDGTEAGTVLVKDMIPGNDIANYPSDFKAIDNKLFFSANDGIHGTELWVSNGTADGTYVIDIVEGAADSNPDVLAGIEGVMYFNADGKLWRTNGSTFFIEMVSPMEALEIVFLNGWIYFSGPGEYGFELFKIPFTPVSIENHRKEISLFPNPAKDKIKIHSEGFQHETSIEIIDFNSRVLATYTIPINGFVEHSVAEYAEGMYIIKIRSGKTTIHKKFIKQ